MIGVDGCGSISSTAGNDPILQVILVDARIGKDHNEGMDVGEQPAGSVSGFRTPRDGDEVDAGTGDGDDLELTQVGVEVKLRRDEMRRHEASLISRLPQAQLHSTLSLVPAAWATGDLCANSC